MPCCDGNKIRMEITVRKTVMQKASRTVNFIDDVILTLIESTGPTLYMQQRSVPSQMSLSSSGFPDRFSSWWMNWAKAFIRFALPPTHTNYGKQRQKAKKFHLLTFEIVNPSFLNQQFTNLNISEHFWKVVSLGAQAEVVQNIFLHVVQVGVFDLDRFSKSNIVHHINKNTDCSSDS